jgi:hypothetical protein
MKILTLILATCIALILYARNPNNGLWSGTYQAREMIVSFREGSGFKSLCNVSITLYVHGDSVISLKNWENQKSAYFRVMQNMEMSEEDGLRLVYLVRDATVQSKPMVLILKYSKDGIKPEYIALMNENTMVVLTIYYGKKYRA